jgi:hypothetical protein
VGFFTEPFTPVAGETAGLFAPAVAVAGRLTGVPLPAAGALPFAAGAAAFPLTPAFAAAGAFFFAGAGAAPSCSILAFRSTPSSVHLASQAFSQFTSGTASAEAAFTRRGEQAGFER